MGSSSSTNGRNAERMPPQTQTLPYFTDDQFNAMLFNGYPPPLPQAPPPVVHSARTVRNDVNVKRDSITLEKSSGGDANTFYLRFAFDGSRPCSVSVYVAATETTNERNVTTRLKPKREDGVSKLAFFDKGVKQTYSQAESKEAGIDLSKYSASDLEYKAAAPNVYPLVILLQARDDVGSGDVAGQIDLPDPNTVQSQLTYASISRHADGSASVKVLKQKIQVLGAAYELQAIYGMGEDGTGDDACVVCLSAPKNTTVLPCRHMCLCRDCAEELRLQTNKCPICRAPVSSLLKIDLDRPRDAARTASADSGQGAGAGEGAGAGAGEGAGAGGGV